MNFIRKDKKIRMVYFKINIDGVFTKGPPYRKHLKIDG